MRCFLLLLVAISCHAQLVPYVEGLVTHGRLADAQLLTERFRHQHGTTPEVLTAMSWLARGEMNDHQYAKAETDAEEVRGQVKATLTTRKLDSDAYLGLALGATYEVQAQCMVAEGRRSEALQLLEAAEKEYRGASIEARLQKNILLLTLVGHTLPAIQGTAKTWSGKPVLLFFWAHWCPDCKAMGPSIAKLATEFEPKGLVVLAPTRYYGYTSEKESVTPQEEKGVIDEVYQRFYSIIPKAIVPVEAANFERFGASTTPTIVVADRGGIVKLYHPGAMTEAALRQVIESVVRSSR